MRKRLNGIVVFLALLLAAFMWSGCSNVPQPAGKNVVTADSEPSDGDIVKAIDDSGIMKRADGSLTVVPPVTIVERGKRNKDGSWPVKVELTLTYKMKDGRKSPRTETTTSFRIFTAKGDAGKLVWKAQLGS